MITVYFLHQENSSKYPMVTIRNSAVFNTVKQNEIEMRTNLRALFAFFWVTSVVTLMVACGDDEAANPTILNSTQASNKARTIVSGQVTSSGLDSINGEWDVNIVTSAGAAVKVELVQSTGIIDKIEGTSGPFDYEAKPGLGLINFSSARSTALTANSTTLENIKFWELKQNDVGTWIYLIEFVEGPSVKVNASTGGVIQ